MPDSKHHKKLQDDLTKRIKDSRDGVAHYTENLKNASLKLEYDLGVQAAYFLLSTLTLWVKMPKHKANMREVGRYVKRRMGEKYKEKVDQDHC